jgi:GntR family transcriptional regulator/MocR family aminotransferase
MERSKTIEFDEARWIELERRPSETLRLGVERTLREAIQSGALRPGVRLPSSRALAGHLGVSRGVTTEAYLQLAAQGYLVTRTKAAPVVADVRVAPATIARPAAAPRPVRYDFTPNTPDVTLFPAGRWSSALQDAVRTLPLGTYDYGDPRGEPELRRVLADQLGRTRGVVCDPAQIVVVQGAAQGIDLLARVLAIRGARRVAVEDPSLDSQPQRFRSRGLDVVAQPVDADGLLLDGLHADAVLVTPAHQFPTGAVLSGSRRRALLEWARHRGRFVLEDDYDAEFRYDRKPVRALQGLDADRVAYLGTTSKTLAPALRLGWVVLPAELADEGERVKHLLDVCSPAVEQHALARFIVRGDYDRHVRRARGIYRRRCERLLEALERHLPGLEVEGVAAGMHVLLRLPAGLDDRAVAARGEERGVRVIPLSQFCIATTADGGLVLGYGRIHEHALQTAVRDLARAIDAPNSGE